MSLHADATGVLTRYRPADARQEELRADYLAHLAAHPDAVLRSCVPGHLTASAIIVDPTGARVLLVLHRKARLWLQTGGHCEPGDTTLAATAFREAAEESGLHDLRVLADPVLLDRHPAPGAAAIDHLDVMFAAVAAADAVPRASAESLAAEWFDADALPEPTDDAVRALVAAAAARLRGAKPADLR